LTPNRTFYYLRRVLSGNQCRHFGAGRNPVFLALQHKRRWMPACAGMTDIEFSGKQRVSINAK
jgi:hypothetical protein